MDIFQALILGIIQGIAEWLPISSSGHLVLAQHYFGITVPVAFDILLHLGTVLVVFIVFWKDISAIPFSILQRKNDKNTRLALYILIGTIPTGIIGIVFHDLLISFFSNVKVVAAGLILTGIVLLLTKYTKGTKSIDSVRAFIVGISQGIAIVPGISRSGSTIATAQFLGVKREDAARFSFLLLVPAVLGAALLEIKNFSGLEIIPSLIGFIASVIVGYAALKIMLKIVSRGKLHYFGIYCLIVGIIVLIISL